MILRERTEKVSLVYRLSWIQYRDDVNAARDANALRRQNGGMLFRVNCIIIAAHTFRSDENRRLTSRFHAAPPGF